MVTPGKAVGVVFFKKRDELLPFIIKCLLTVCLGLWQTSLQHWTQEELRKKREEAQRRKRLGNNDGTASSSNREPQPQEEAITDWANYPTVSSQFDR